jgi:hypothetical protein
MVGTILLYSRAKLKNVANKANGVVAAINVGSRESLAVSAPAVVPRATSNGPPCKATMVEDREKGGGC